MNKKLFPLYTYEKDYFYESRLSELSEDELLELEKVFLDIPPEIQSPAEIIIRRLLKSKFFSNGETVLPQDVVFLILLHVPYITRQSIHDLKLWETKDQINYFFKANTYSDKNRKGKLRSFSIPGNSLRAAYTLTSTGRTQILEMLPTKYINSHIFTSERASSGTSVHDAMCTNLFYRLLGDVSFPFFEWIPSPYFSGTKSFPEVLENITTVLPEKETTGLKPDAFIKTLDKMPTYLYIEQDMCKETTSYLSDKFKKYETFFEKQDLQFLCSSALIFSIYTDSDMRKKNKRSSLTSASKMSRIRADINLFFTTIENETKEKVTIQDMYKRLEHIISSKNVKKGTGTYNSYVQMYMLLTDVLKKNPSATSFVDVEKYIDNSIISSKNSQKEELENASVSIYNKRVINICDAIKELPIFQSLLRKGLQFIVLDSFKASDVDKSLLKEYRKDVIFQTLLPLLCEKHLKKKYTFNVQPIMMISNHLALNNHYIPKENSEVHLVFENISTDIGARYRVQSFLDGYEDILNQKIYLYLLVEKKEFALTFNQECLENNPLDERYGSPVTALQPKGNISIAYISYENKEEFLKPFVVEHNQELLYI